MSIQEIRYEEVNMPDSFRKGFRFLVTFNDDNSDDPIFPEMGSGAKRGVYLAAMEFCPNHRFTKGLRDLADRIDAGEGALLGVPIQWITQ